MPLITDEIDLLFDPLTGDLDPSLSMSTGTQAAVQRIQFALKLHLEEWFLDLSAGFPWHQEIYGKKFDGPKIRSRVRTELLSIDTVSEITDLIVELSDKRILSIRFRVLLEFEDTTELVNGSVDLVI